MLPGRGHVRRLSAASLALSAGALMVFGASAPAAAADPQQCVKGHDPETSIADIKCQFHNNVETIKDKIDEANGTKGDKGDKGDKPSSSDKDKNQNKPKNKTVKPGQKPRAPVTPQTIVRRPANTPIQVPGDFTVQTAPESATDALPEQPQVADAPQPEQTIALPQTRLVEPVAAIRPLEEGSDRALWAAGGSAAITAVVMAQFSLIGARLRRRAPRRR